MFAKVLSKGRLAGASSGQTSDLKMGEEGRPMKYPYTLTAKIVQFPYKFYMNNNWIYKYYPLGLLLTAPIFYKIGKLSYSPENVKKWEEIRRHTFTPHHHD